MSIRVKVPMGRMGQIEKKISANIRPYIQKAMRVAARQSIPVLSARVMDAPPASDSPHSKKGAYAGGSYLGGWEVDHTMSPKIAVWVYNKTAYAGYVDKGVRARGKLMGIAASKNLAIWVKQRGIKFTDKTGRVLTEKQMAWAILIAMNKRKDWRLKPRKTGVRASPRIAEIFHKRIQEALDRCSRDGIQ